MTNKQVDNSGRLTVPESKTLEYKLDLSSPDRVLKSIIAFANSAGGELLIGVADDGEVVGVGDPLTEQDRLANLVADSIRPQLAPIIELVPMADKTVLIAKVWPGNQRPYYLAGDGPDKGTYIRVGASNRQAGAGMVAELGRYALGQSFDELPALRARLSNIDTGYLSDLLHRDVDEQMLLTLGLVVEDQGQLLPTNGGVLVGCRNPETFLPHAWVQCARFRGDSMRHISDQARITGPLPDAVDKTMGFLIRNAFLRAEFGQIRRKDTYSIPIAPLRELIVNALVHSSYADHGTPIKVAFNDTSIVIESPGGLLPGLTVERVLQGVSQIRNPVLARVFSELGLIEQWGTGLPKAMDALVAAGLAPMDIEEGQERLKIIVHIENHDPEKRGSEQRVYSERAQVSEQVEAERAQVSEQVEAECAQVSLGPRGEAILRALSAGPLTRAQTLAAAAMSNAFLSYQRHLVPLIDDGLVRMTDPQKPTARTQRYVITPAGRAALEYLDGQTPPASDKDQ